MVLYEETQGAEKDDDNVCCAMQYKDLDLSSQLSMTVWCWKVGEVKEIVLGGTTFAFFSKKERLKTGSQCVDLHPGQVADESIESCTSRKVLQCRNDRLR